MESKTFKTAKTVNKTHFVITLHHRIFITIYFVQAAFEFIQATKINKLGLQHYKILR